MKRILLTSVLGFSFFASAAAFASSGYVVGNVTLYAGPDAGYPSVGMLNAGTPVIIEGCVNGWSWCDVGTPDGRGWVPGNSLQEDYQGQRVFVPEYGERIGIGFVVFNFGTYWDANYRSRPWYGERTRYSQIRPQYRTIVNVNVNVNTRSQPARDGRRADNIEPVRPGTGARPHERAVADQRPDAVKNHAANKPMPAKAAPPKTPEPKPHPKNGQNDSGTKDNGQH